MRKKLMIAAGSYTTQDGQAKTVWKEVGIIMTSQAGKEFALLDPCINLAGFPREPGKDMIIASIFEDKPKEQGYQQQQATPRNNIDDVNRRNSGGSHNRPSEQQERAYNQQQSPPAQETYYDANGSPIPL